MKKFWSARKRAFWMMVMAVVVSATVFITLFWESEVTVFNRLGNGDVQRRVEDRHDAMTIRRWKANDACQRLGPIQGPIPANQLDHIVVNDERKILYCYVPKVASTNWKRIMLLLENNGSSEALDVPAEGVHNQTLFPTLAKYSAEEIDYRLNNYFKFLFVRHPFERLVSAYRNKFQRNYSVYFQHRFGRLVVKRYRKDPEPSALLRGNDVTFEEFVRYLLDPLTAREGPLNEHWRPISSLCHPCRVRYDAIGKYESLEEDARYVLDRARIGHLVSFPKVNRTVITADLVSLYMSNLTEDSVSGLRLLYNRDFRIFAYSRDQFL